MEADRGQADVATVLSVGVHTSPCAGPRLRSLHANTHNPGYLRGLGSDLGVGGSSSCSCAGCWFTGCFINKRQYDGDTVSVIYDHLKGPVDYVRRGWMEMRGLPVWSPLQLWIIFPLIHSALLLNEEGWASLCVYINVCGVHDRGGGSGQRPWELPNQVRSQRVWLLPHRLESISWNRKSSSLILIIFYFISVFSFTPPFLSSLSLFPSDFILLLLHLSSPLRSPPSVLESDCLLYEIVVHSLLALSVSLPQQNHLPLSNFIPVSVLVLFIWEYFDIWYFIEILLLYAEKGGTAHDAVRST